MIFKRSYLIILLFFSINGYSQNWQSLNGGANNQALCIYGDTTNNILYAAGYFTSVGGIPANYIAKWDGTTWSSMGSGLYGWGFGHHSFTEYKGKIVSALNTFSPSKQHISSWSGTQWDSIGSNFSSGGIEGVITLNKELYSFGAFDIVNSIHYNGIAKFDTISNTWVSIGFPYTMPTTSAIIRCLQMYHGQLYAGGVFKDSTGVIANIARYNGSYWSIVGQGITGSMDDVFAMGVYQNELYVAGAFTVNDGNPWNNIARWNDTTWNDVGGGLTSFGQINSLLVLNNKLYAGGAYDAIGGIPAASIASWDGANWCGLGNVTTSGTSCLAAINHDLFLNCATVWDTVTVNYIAQWIGGSYVDTCGFAITGINEVRKMNSTLSVYPNPATNQISIEFDLIETKNTSIEIKNVLGQTVKTTPNSSFQKGTNKIEMDVSEFSQGIYFVQLQSGNKIINQKFIKQ